MNHDIKEAVMTEMDDNSVVASVFQAVNKQAKIPVDDQDRLKQFLNDPAVGDCALHSVEIGRDATEYDARIRLAQSYLGQD